MEGRDPMKPNQEQEHVENEDERAEFEKAFKRLYPYTQTGSLFHNQCWEFWKERAALNKWTNPPCSLCMGSETLREEIRAVLRESTSRPSRIRETVHEEGCAVFTMVNDCQTGTCNCRANTSPSPRTQESAERLAQRFHEVYERLAPQFEYRTRVASAVPWWFVPIKMRQLMTAVCAEILAALREPEAPSSGFEAAIRSLFPVAWMNKTPEGRYWYPVIDDFRRVWDAARAQAMVGRDPVDTSQGHEHVENKGQPEPAKEGKRD